MAISESGYIGEKKAHCICDQCGKEHFVKMPNVHHGHIDQRLTWLETKKNDPHIRHHRIVIKNLQRMGWKIYTQEVVCGGCLESRRKDKNMKNQASKITEIRKPTREQKREIMLCLNDVYDIDLQRYRKANSDKQVAKDLKDGILFGWVAEIREEIFGPDGNEANLLALGDAKMWMNNTDADLKLLKTKVDEVLETYKLVETAKYEMAGLIERLERAVG